MKPSCSHCGSRHAVAGRLCKRCRLARSARCRAVAKSAALARAEANEPTEAEVEATIAEQSKRLPDWWTEDLPTEDRPDVPLAVARGHGLFVYARE